MNTILPIASGKGGVGKTSLVSNLGTALSQAGKTVVLVDLDLGGSNLHTALGVKNRHPGLGSLIYKKVSSVEDLLVPTEQERLYLIPGDSLLPGTANLPYFIKKKIIKSLKDLVADYVILDLGSGSSYNTVDFFLTTPAACLVTIPENTAVLNAYGFLKTALFRMLYLSMNAHSEERIAIKQFAGGKIEGTERNFDLLMEELEKINPDSAKKALTMLEEFHPMVIFNMLREPHDAKMAYRLEAITQRNLQQELDFIGSIGWDPAMRQAIQERTPLINLNPESSFRDDISRIAQVLIETPRLQEHPLRGAAGLF